VTSDGGLFFGLYETYGLNGFWVFVLTTLVMGGAAALASGRAVADSWDDARKILLYAALLALAVRFVQFSIFNQPLLPLVSYLIDAAVLTLFGYLGYRLRRTAQMTRAYPWLYERTSPVTWRTKTA
jgi:hypothetical protein